MSMNAEAPVKSRKFQELEDSVRSLEDELALLQDFVQRLQDGPAPPNPPTETTAQETTFYSVYNSAPARLEVVRSGFANLRNSLRELLEG